MANKIIGILGKKFAGKDVFASYLKEIDPTIQHINFADKLKEVCAEVFNLGIDIFTDPKKKELDLKYTISIDEFLPRLEKELGFKKKSLKPLGKVASTPRELLQYVGTDYVRAYQDDYWTQDHQEKVKSIKGIVVVSDVRFPDEGNSIKDQCGDLVRIIRMSQLMGVDLHKSETSMDHYIADYTVSTYEDDFEPLKKLAKELLS